MADGNDLVTVYDLVLIRETEKAYGVVHKEEIAFGKCLKPIDVWLPKSQVDRSTLVYLKPGEVDIPRWLAEKNNLEYEE
jgi:hypothetical protein